MVKTNSHAAVCRKQHTDDGSDLLVSVCLLIPLILLQLFLALSARRHYRIAQEYKDVADRYVAKGDAIWNACLLRNGEPPLQKPKVN